MKLQTKLSYFQPVQLSFHNLCSPDAGQTLKCLTFLLDCCIVFFTLFMVPSCRVLIDNLQAAMDAQFDSKARTASHSYEKYNDWDTVKSTTFTTLSASYLTFCSQSASSLLPFSSSATSIDMIKLPKSPSSSLLS